jgi:hypothetical protein
MIQEQPWKPPYEIVEMPQERARLLFPQNYFSATIVHDHIQLSISTDAAGFPAVMERLDVLLEFAKLGPMPQAAIFDQPREAVAEDFALAQVGVTEGGDTSSVAPVSEAN